MCVLQGRSGWRCGCGERLICDRQPPLQGALTVASVNRSSGGKHACRIPCLTPNPPLRRGGSRKFGSWQPSGIGHAVLIFHPQPSPSQRRVGVGLAAFRHGSRSSAIFNSACQFVRAHSVSNYLLLRITKHHDRFRRPGGGRDPVLSSFRTLRWTGFRPPAYCLPGQAPPE